MNDGELPTFGYRGDRLLPPATELERIENINGGATERMLTMAERQQAHRHAWVNAALTAHIAEVRRTNLYAFAFAVTALLCAFGLGWIGHPTPAGVIGGGTIATVVTAFVIGGRGRRLGTPDQPTR